MRSIRFTSGRVRGERSNALQSIGFHANEWSATAARQWLSEHGYASRDLKRRRDWLVLEVRSRSVFVPRTLRTVETKGQENVTMASNPKKSKRAKSTRRALKRRKNPKRASAKKKVTRSVVHTVKTMRTNPKRKKRAPKKKRARALKRNARPAARAKPQASRYTIALSPMAARSFVQVARISQKMKRLAQRALRRHPTGGVYVADAAWHGTRDEAARLADRVKIILAYAAGRRRSALTSSSVPRVVAVP